MTRTGDLARWAGALIVGLATALGSAICGASTPTAAVPLPATVAAPPPVALGTAANGEPVTVDLRRVGAVWIAPGDEPGSEAWLRTPVTAYSTAPSGATATTDGRAPDTVRLRPGQSLWLYAPVTPGAPGQVWFVRVPSPNVDHVSVYLSQDGLQWSRADAGDQVLVSHQQYRSLVPLFALTPHLGGPGPLHVLVRVTHGGSFSAPVEIVDQDTVFYQRFTAALWFGAYFGLAVMLVMLAVVRGLLLGNTALLAFAAFVCVVAVAMAAHIGVAGLYFWPDAPAWNHWSKYVLLGVSGGAFLAAMAWSLSLSNLQPRFSRGMLLAGALVCAYSLNIPWLDWPGPQAAINGSFALVAGSAMAACVVAWRRGDPMARPLSLAVGIALVGTTVTWAYTRGHLFTVPVAWYALPVSLTLTVAIWYYGLAAHVQRMNETRIREAALLMQDPLTGLANARALGHKIQRMVARCDEFRHSAAFVVVKFLNGAEVTEEHGRSVIETALVKVAASLRHLLRPVDMAARMGSFTYACAIEGPVTEDQLRTLCTRIVAAGLALKADLPEQVCPDLAVWVLRAPAEGRTLSELYGAARPRFEGRDRTSPKRIFL